MRLLDDLIEALKILKKYIGNDKYPSWAEHDVFGIAINEEKVKIENIDEKDIKRLEELGFDFDYESYSFISYRFGSC